MRQKEFRINDGARLKLHLAAYFDSLVLMGDSLSILESIRCDLLQSFHFFFLPSIMVAYLVSLFLAVMLVQVLESTLLFALAAVSFSVYAWLVG